MIKYDVRELLALITPTTRVDIVERTNITTASCSIWSSGVLGLVSNTMCFQDQYAALFHLRGSENWVWTGPLDWTTELTFDPKILTRNVTCYGKRDCLG